MRFPIQITTGCNMKCSHCMFSCTEFGEDMTLKTFEKTIDLIFEKFVNYDEVLLTGGEPTIHPMILQFLEISMKYFGKNVVIVTNGKKRETVLKLIDLSLREGFGLSLSQDGYHEKIDQDIVDRFVLCGDMKFNIGIKKNRRLAKIGRSKEGREIGDSINPIVDPNGIIWENVKKEKKISDVFTESCGTCYV